MILSREQIIRKGECLWNGAINIFTCNCRTINPQHFVIEADVPQRGKCSLEFEFVGEPSVRDSQ